MRHKHTKWLVAVALAAVMTLVSASAVFANGAVDPVGTGALFDMGMGARALGMGGAFVAVADDGNAVYYNPAGLALVDGNKVTSMYSSTFGAGSYFGLGYAGNNMGAAAFGLTSQVDGTDDYGNPLAPFSYAEGTLVGGYARALGPIAVGGALKLYGQDVPENRGYGVTGDAGIMLSLPDFIGFKVGAVARNVVGTVKFESGHTDKFDMVLVVGASVKPFSKATIAADYDITHKTVHAGAEYEIIPAFTARAGGMVTTDGKYGFAAGAGFVFSGIHVDYAYQFHADLPDAHWLSLGFSF